jgi:hypothetical protein
MSRLTVHNPRSITVLDLSAGPVRMLPYAGCLGTPVSVNAQQGDAVSVPLIDCIGQYLPGGFKGHDQEFGPLVMDWVYEQIRRADPGDVCIDAKDLDSDSLDGRVLLDKLAHSWITPELKASIDAILPPVTGVHDPRSQPKSHAFRHAVEAFKCGNVLVMPDQVRFQTAEEMILGGDGRWLYTDRALLEKLRPVEEWKILIAQATTVYLNAWYALEGKQS